MEASAENHNKSRCSAAEPSNSRCVYSTTPPPAKAQETLKKTGRKMARATGSGCCFVIATPRKVGSCTDEISSTYLLNVSWNTTEKVDGESTRVPNLRQWTTGNQGCWWWEIVFSWDKHTKLLSNTDWSVLRTHILVTRYRLNKLLYVCLYE